MMYAAMAAALFALGAMGLYSARRSSYHRGKADAFQQVADDFTGLSRATWLRDRDQQKQERKRLMLRLCLCDPRVRDALAAALIDAEAHWGRRSPAPAEGPEKPPEEVRTA